MSLIIGSHVSFKSDTGLVGSIKESLSYEANTFMFYTGAPQNTKRKELDLVDIEEGKKLMQENNIDINNVIVHAPYIVNLCNEDNFDFSVNFLKEELHRCSILGVNKMVLHPGSAVNGMDRDVAINNIISGLNIILDNDNNVSILLETMAGKGNEVGRTFEELAKIIEGVNNKDKIGVCLDTCHINDAGYDISNIESVLDEFDKVIGLNYLKCLHINDSKNIRGSHKDRHENIGLGTLGFDNIINIIYNKRLDNLPKILETPYVGIDDESKEKIYPPYKYEITMIKDKKFNPHLLEEIRSIN